MIVANVGINDIFNGLDPRANYEYFANSCREKNIKLFICNLGAHENYDSMKLESAKSVNEYLHNELMIKFPEVEIIDYLGWSTNWTYEYTTTADGLFEDAVHPNKKGYEEFSRIVIDHLQSYYNETGGVY